jgi:cell filamentation protein
VEGRAALRRELVLDRHRFPRTFDLDHLRLLHWWLFRDVYDWAGQIRTVPINKDGSEFAQPRFIESEMNRVSLELRAEHILQSIAESDLARRLAYYFGELNALHAFREGNGRVQRLFLRHVLAPRGLTLAWESVTADEMVAVSVAVHRGDERPAQALFERILEGA